MSNNDGKLSMIAVLDKLLECCQGPVNFDRVKSFQILKSLYPNLQRLDDIDKSYHKVVIQPWANTNFVIKVGNKNTVADDVKVWNAVSSENKHHVADTNFGTYCEIQRFGEQLDKYPGGFKKAAKDLKEIGKELAKDHIYDIGHRLANVRVFNGVLKMIDGKFRTEEVP